MPTKKKMNNSNKIPADYKCIAFATILNKLAHYIDPKISWEEVCADLERSVRPFETKKLGPVVISQNAAMPMVDCAINYTNANLPKDKQIVRKAKDRQSATKTKDTAPTVKALEDQIKNMSMQIEALSKMVNSNPMPVRAVGNFEDNVRADLKNGPKCWPLGNLNSQTLHNT